MTSRVSLVLLLLGCGGAVEPAEGGVDAGALIDGGGSAMDAAGPTDAGADAASPADGGTDGGPVADAGPDPMPEGCITSVAAGHHVFDCEDLAFDVELSASCAMGRCGLIFDVHGATMDAASEDRNTNLRMLGSARGYVVVQPTAPGSTLGPSWDPARDDPKVFRFLQLAMRAFRIDPDRVHFTGFSQGGFMSWRMLCRHADLFASVAPAAACGTLFPHCAFSASERPSREIPVLYIHGRSDNIVGGCEGSQRDAVVSGWSMTPQTVVSMDADHVWARYASPSGNVFEFIEHDYTAYSRILGGHCLPGSPDIGTNRFGTSGFGCEQTSPFDWGEAVIAFFEAHPRP